MGNPRTVNRTSTVRDAIGRACVAAALVGVSVLPAAADATAFVGVASEPAVRRTLGFGVGAGLLVVGFEFEYAYTQEDIEDLAPSVRTFMGNLLVQTPVPLGGIQFYGTVGAGVYREAYSEELVRLLVLPDESETNVGTNLGGGIKYTIAGPLRLRLDYRVFLLRGSPLFDKPQRFYAGLNLAF
jgi:hypothetical protein